MSDEKKGVMGRIVFINLAILFSFNVLVFVSVSGHESSLGILIYDAFIVSTHFVILIIIGLASHNEYKRAYLISGLLILTIGFGTCLLSSSLKNSRNNNTSTYQNYPASKPFDDTTGFWKPDSLDIDSTWK